MHFPIESETTQGNGGRCDGPCCTGNAAVGAAARSWRSRSRATRKEPLTCLGEFITELKWLGGRINDFRYWLFGGIASLRLWLPVIWRDRNYDHCYIYRIIAHKLRMQADAFEQHGIHVGADRDAKQMRVCAQLLERLIEDDYDQKSHWHKKSEQLFGKITMELGEDGRVNIGRERISSASDCKLERFYATKQHEHAERMAKQDLALFAKIFARKSRGWWD